MSPAKSRHEKAVCACALGHCAKREGREPDGRRCALDTLTAAPVAPPPKRPKRVRTAVATQCSPPPPPPPPPPSGSVPTSTEPCGETRLDDARGLLYPMGSLNEYRLGALSGLLDRAQNPPPDGAADGSITPAQYGALRTLLNASRQYVNALHNAIEALR